MRYPPPRYQFWFSSRRCRSATLVFENRHDVRNLITGTPESAPVYAMIQSVNLSSRFDLLWPFGERQRIAGISNWSARRTINSDLRYVISKSASPQSTIAPVMPSRPSTCSRSTRAVTERCCMAAMLQVLLASTARARSASSCGRAVGIGYAMTLI
jgi:hypothetical protein